jgi:hypothetical protein
MKTFDRHPYLKHPTSAPYMPAHKDTKHPAGQVLPTVEELKGQQSLSDYIRSINRAQAFDNIAAEKKVTFDKWYPVNKDKIGFNYEVAQLIWNAALTRGTLS